MQLGVEVGPAHDASSGVPGQAHRAGRPRDLESCRAHPAVQPLTGQGASCSPGPPEYIQPASFPQPLEREVGRVCQQSPGAAKSLSPKQREMMDSWWQLWREAQKR